MTLRILSLIFFLCLFASCRPADDPQYIVDRAIEAHGGDVLAHAVIEFDYRGKHYKVMRNRGIFSYERFYADSTGSVHEVLNNDDVYRMVNGERVELDPKKLYSVEESLNSIVYFSLVPFFLNDPPVQKKYLGTSEIDGEPYYEIEITFRQEGGGPDYEDRFVYWIHQDRYTMDYFAYDYHINEGGTRFRKAFNVRTIEGIRFADFLNYTTEALPQPGTPIEDYEEYMRADSLELLSEIIWENIEVRVIE